MRCPPSPHGAPGAKDEPQQPVDIAGEGIDGEGRHHVDHHDRDLMHVDVHEVHSHQIIKSGHEEKPDADLDEPAVEADGEHCRIDPLLPFSVCLRRLIPFLRLWEKDRDDRPDHDHTEDALEPGVADCHPHDGADDCTGERPEGELQALLESMHLQLSKRGDGKDVLDQDGDAVGPVGETAIESHEDQRGERKRGSAARHDVEEAGDDSDREEKKVMICVIQSITPDFQ